MRGQYIFEGNGQPLFTDFVEAEPSRDGFDKNLHELRAPNE
jgi:hypothetical protein